LIRSLILVLLK